jgi:hypothetical protein
MGCAGSKDGEISAVDLALAEAAAAAERHFKVLLLGCGESGKVRRTANLPCLPHFGAYVLRLG